MAVLQDAHKSSQTPWHPQQSNRTVNSTPAQLKVALCAPSEQPCIAATNSRRVLSGETTPNGGPDQIRTGGLVLDRDACWAATPRDLGRDRLYRGCLNSRQPNAQ